MHHIIKKLIEFSIAFSSLSFTVNACSSELDELATTQRLLDQVQLSLDRARTVAAQSAPNNRRR
ncbi:RAQPRD family integrative conjugative element protein [Pantoea dispersa]|uniref:RAQPRD family integrative conjugative element protein n=1 Tax=Pantoea dispersa TaxID=59814 RepID=UPI001FD50B42|nr:RAQPRD family integrative conjugative element protein [Pantoea dispersa]